MDNAATRRCSSRSRRNAPRHTLNGARRATTGNPKSHRLQDLVLYPGGDREWRHRNLHLLEILWHVRDEFSYLDSGKFPQIPNFRTGISAHHQKTRRREGFLG